MWRDLKMDRMCWRLKWAVFELRGGHVRKIILVKGGEEEAVL